MKPPPIRQVSRYGASQSSIVSPGTLAGDNLEVENGARQAATK
jgi:hypothetical protein